MQLNNINILTSSPILKVYVFKVSIFTLSQQNVIHCWMGNNIFAPLRSCLECSGPNWYLWRMWFTVLFLQMESLGWCQIPICKDYHWFSHQLSLLCLELPSLFCFSLILGAVFHLGLVPLHLVAICRAHASIPSAGSGVAWVDFLYG